ncbi:MAG: hypothetical protein IBX50_10075 [Marinospirillum sp.]|uniref:hypothetical protein n=1 Tax=Marinospirillum sp. TaxID=2183934 RepID=UPI0019F9535E|nr:hypothetical protein [Marinospirillum sp.]MBE0507049.1 hypothetical protein [Marinospirillum sp.]
MAQREFIVTMMDSLGGVRLEQMMLKEWICWDKTLQHLEMPCGLAGLAPRAGANG